MNPRNGGFTLLELLVVISIIVILMALLAVVGGSMRNNAKVKATQGLVEGLTIVLENYRSKMGKYPSDGIDAVVETEDGTVLRSGAALSYAICRPLKLKIRRPGKKVRYKEEPPIVGELVREGDLYRHEVDPNAFEIVDAWASGLHYDNVEGGIDSYSEQGELGEQWHLHPVDKNDPDPREDLDVVFNTGPQSTNQYDLWSSGRFAHSEDYYAMDTIANFRIRSDAESQETKED